MAQVALLNLQLRRPLGSAGATAVRTPLTGFGSGCVCFDWLPCPQPAPPCYPQTREYFIAAVEEVWDYAPFGGEMCGGSLVNFSDNAKTFLEPGPDRVGRKYVKALYVEYTDATFTQKKVGPASIDTQIAPQITG